MIRDINILSLRAVRESRTKYNVDGEMTSPSKIYDVLLRTIDIQNRTEEYFCVISLDAKCKINDIYIVAQGSLSAAIIHPREVFKRAVLSNASSIIVAHNHPSGDCTPSKEDILISKRLLKAGGILGIDLLDSIIVSYDSIVSMKEENLLKL